MGEGSTKDEPSPRLSVRWKQWLVPLICITLTVSLYTISFAPFNQFASAFVCFCPFIAWAMFRPRIGLFALAAFVTSFFCWFSSIPWLIHLGEHLGGLHIGLICWAGCSLIFCWGIWIWLLLLHRIIPRILDKSFIIRILGMCALAGAWVLLEWAREEILGVQWNTLSSTLWQQPALLQVASVTGAWGLSFFIVFFNLGIAYYVRHLIVRGWNRKSFFQRFCPEFYILFGALGLMIWFFFQNLDLAREQSPMFRAGIVQPDINQKNKMDPRKTESILSKSLFPIMTRLASQEPAPDIYLWPETATPLEATGNTPIAKGVSLMIGSFLEVLGKPLLMGNMKVVEEKIFLEPDESADPGPDGGLPLLKESSKLKGLGSGFSVLHAPPLVQSASDSRDGKVDARAFVNSKGSLDISVSDNRKFQSGEQAVIWFSKLYNGIFYASPQDGISDQFYAKQQLVPFGEYVPFGRYLPFLKKIVSIKEEFVAGTDSVQLSFELEGQNYKAGPLVCYEDVFSRISREHASAGADFLFVATNDGWYGTRGAAYQHAAHSVLRAVETRRPVLRCGNNGWSGWINELGIVRQVLTGDDGTVYSAGRKKDGTRGAGMILDVRQITAFGDSSTFYVRNGDWFVILCAAFVLGGLLYFRRQSSSANGDKSKLDDAH